MEDQQKDPATTSRRDFTKAVITAAIAAPVASIASSTLGQRRKKTADDCPVRVIEGSGYTEITLIQETEVEEHIPPMGIEGGGSLTIDSRNQLLHSGSKPFVYVEEADIQDPNRYGDIEAANIITELTDKPWLKVSYYAGFLPGTQLLLWYQPISATAQGNDTNFPPQSYPDDDPDIRIVGGAGAAKFQMLVKKAKFKTDKSHKENRPYRFKHTKGGVLGRHFRIGQWRFLNKAGTLVVGDSGAENYRIFLTFADYQ
jgi:hypothetical protein